MHPLCLLQMHGAAPEWHRCFSERQLWCWHLEKLGGVGEGVLLPSLAHRPSFSLVHVTLGGDSLAGQHLGAAGGFTHGASNPTNPPVNREMWHRGGPSGTQCQPYRMIEQFLLENTLKIIKSNC